MTDAGARAIPWPVLGQVALTFVAWIARDVQRRGEMRRRRTDRQRMRTRPLAAGVPENVAAADDFSNRFELPVPFYAVVPLRVLAPAVTGAALALPGAALWRQS